MTVVVERHWADLGSAGVSYQVAGHGDPLILVHGLAGSTRWWAKNVDFLAERHRVYVVDLVGFGGSRAQQPFVLREAAAILIRWMDALSLQQASVIGHSMGGFIAVDLAADFPARVRKLVLVDAAALPLERGYPGHALGIVQGLRRMPIGFLPVLVTDSFRAGLPAIWSAAHQLLASDIRDKLPRVQAPALIIWGAKDAVVPLPVGRQLHEALPGSELVVIPRAGHNPMWDQPREFNARVEAFLKDEPRRAASTPRSAA